MSFSRRKLLLGSAGALALPLLQQTWVGAQATKRPKRLVLFYNPNGTVPENWFPQDGSGETDFALPKILTPFEKHRKRLTVVKGVDGQVAIDPANNGGPHQRGIGALYTGQMLLEGEFVDGCGSKAGWADGISIDQAVANHIGLDTPFRSLELGVRATSNDVQGRISYAESGAPLPPTNSPQQLYERLFLRTAPLDPENPDSRAQSILDSTKEQFGHLQKQVGLEDREKLEKHLALVEDLERRLGLSVTLEPGAFCGQPSDPGEMDVDSEETMENISRAHLDLLATAFACDLTRVATVQYSTGFNLVRYPWIDEQGEGHPLSHSGDSNTEAWNALTERASWHASEIAYFLDRLADIPEGDGSVLDNTLCIWASEVSKGNSHSLFDIPYLLLGDAGGALRSGGRFLSYENASNCDLLHAIGAAFGLELSSFGHRDYSNGPLSNLLT